MYEAASFKLRGLDPGARYRIVQFDTRDAQMLTSRELMEHGLTVAFKDRPGAAVITYAEVK